MDSQFIFAACKFGFENECKAEITTICPHLRFSYSRPGFLTFKVTEGSPDFSAINGMTFVRTSGTNLGKIQLAGNSFPEAEIEELQQRISDFSIEHLHVWSRRLGSVDDDLLLRFSDGELPIDSESIKRLSQRLNLKVNRRGRNNAYVLDLIEVNEGEIWTAIHKVESPQQSWPGGLVQFARPENLISRAYLKTREAMLWSRFPFQPGDSCVELGCAPGGSALALLESDLAVIGIDPAEVDPAIASHPSFTHIKKRGADVRKKTFSNAKWLFADSNVAPEFTLDMAEDIATNQNVHLKGMILTLKLLEKGLTSEISKYRDRVRQMGFQYVRTRQLAFNRNEICLTALKRKSLLRFGKQTSSKKPGESDPNAGENEN